MHEETGVCPYFGRCGDVRTLRRVEEQLIRERRSYFSRESSLQDDLGSVMEDYRRRLEGVGRAMERCRGGYLRCLRYWQLRRRDEDGTLETHVSARVMEGPLERGG
jgi:hypothetical protein